VWSNTLLGGCAAWLRVKGKLRAMKNTHTCPKCNSQEIMRIEGRMGGHSGHNDISAGGFFRTVKVTRYLCGSCGFSEEWIDAQEDLHKLKEKYGSS
jgi:transcription elongation factor Elf1